MARASGQSGYACTVAQATCKGVKTCAMDDVQGMDIMGLTMPTCSISPQAGSITTMHDIMAWDQPCLVKQYMAEPKEMMCKINNVAITVEKPGQQPPNRASIGLKRIAPVERTT